MGSKGLNMNSHYRIPNVDIGYEVCVLIMAIALQHNTLEKCTIIIQLNVYINIAYT